MSLRPIWWRPSASGKLSAERSLTTVRQRDTDEWRLSAKIANAARWGKASKEDREATGRQLREAKRLRWIMAIDPDGTLSAEELERRLLMREKEEMMRLTKRRLAKKQP